MIATKSHNMGGLNREAHLPTISKKEEENTRISGEEGHSRWKKSTGQKEEKRKEEARGLSSPFSFSKKERLKRKREIDAVLESGQKLANQYLVMIYRPNELDVSRLVVIVGRRFGKAHDRNRFKRYVREYFRLHKASWKRRIDMVVLPRKRLSEEFEKIRYRDVKTLLDDLMGSLRCNE